MPGSGWLVAGGRREASPTRRGDGTGRRGDLPAARWHRSVTGAATAAHYAVVKGQRRFVGPLTCVAASASPTFAFREALRACFSVFPEGIGLFWRSAIAS